MPAVLQRAYMPQSIALSASCAVLRTGAMAMKQAKSVSRTKSTCTHTPSPSRHMACCWCHITSHCVDHLVGAPLFPHMSFARLASSPKLMETFTTATSICSGQAAGTGTRARQLLWHSLSCRRPNLCRTIEIACRLLSRLGCCATDGVRGPGYCRC